jgi:hypothetical protein
MEEEMKDSLNERAGGLPVNKNKLFGNLIYPEESDEFCWDPSNSSKEIHFS